MRTITSEPITLPRGSNSGSIIRHLRISAMLTRQRLADLAEVPLDHVILYEQGLPIPLDSRRRIYRELWSHKTKK